MATKNKTAVMAYLTPELESFVADYCRAHELSFTTKGESKPRLGTGIVRMLDDLRLGNKTFAESKTPKDSPPLPDIEELVKKEVEAAIADAQQIQPPKELLEEMIEKAIDNLPKSELVNIDAQLKALLQAEMGELNDVLSNLMVEVDELKKAFGGVAKPGITTEPAPIPQSHPGQLNLLNMPVADAVQTHSESRKLPKVAIAIPKSSNSNNGGLEHKQLHKILSRLGIDLDIRTIQNWGQKKGKTPPTTDPRKSKEVISIPAYVFTDGKWYESQPGN